ncbi:hypothetical protein F5887DRAFT_1076628 [Amanita rubescens]|nr:hypothetical protein F5887DRAFT_1079574 [Amanita rubescens]KAF8337778.1 hypothetical protein F5887DRAFT_1078014 [Amanita rubescens]KAF8341060.1 hypothetical protein F5887DRAFT_1076628 [Amanita rubescens]
MGLIITLAALDTTAPLPPTSLPNLGSSDLLKGWQAEQGQREEAAALQRETTIGKRVRWITCHGWRCRAILASFSPPTTMPAYLTPPTALNPLTQVWLCIILCKDDLSLLSSPLNEIAHISVQKQHPATSNISYLCHLRSHPAIRPVAPNLHVGDTIAQFSRCPSLQGISLSALQGVLSFTFAACLSRTPHLQRLWLVRHSLCLPMQITVLFSLEGLRRVRNCGKTKDSLEAWSRQLASPPPSLAALHRPYFDKNGVPLFFYLEDQPLRKERAWDNFNHQLENREQRH